MLHFLHKNGDFSRGVASGERGLIQGTTVRDMMSGLSSFGMSVSHNKTMITIRKGFIFQSFHLLFNCHRNSQILQNSKLCLVTMVIYLNVMWHLSNEFESIKNKEDTWSDQHLWTCVTIKHSSLQLYTGIILQLDHNLGSTTQLLEWQKSNKSNN